jgi:uncharacterized protein (TIGR00730 family)
MTTVKKAYNNHEFLNGMEARSIRILCEYEEPKARFLKHGVQDTIVFFGSARARPQEDANHQLAHVRRELARATVEAEVEHWTKMLQKAEASMRLAKYYDNARELAFRLTEWDMQRMGKRRYYISTGAGPGIMEAANRGAADVEGGKSVGLGISLPFEASLNSYVTPELAFEFHYFFTRKYWFLYLCKAMAVFPGGFGTMDELFETLTLRQTQKITKHIPTVLFGRPYWEAVMTPQAMVEWGTISAEDLDLMFITDSVDEAFEFLINGIEAGEKE